MTSESRYLSLGVVVWRFTEQHFFLVVHSLFEIYFTLPTSVVLASLHGAVAFLPWHVPHHKLFHGPSSTEVELQDSHLPTSTMANEEQRRAFASYMGSASANNTQGQAGGQPIPQYPGAVANPGNPYLYAVYE